MYNDCFCALLVVTMRLNLFYGVLNQLLLLNDSKSSFKLLNQITPIHDNTLRNEEYYRLKLPLINIADDDLKLHEAHISIFKYVNYNCPTLGSSHFTAIFLDSTGQAFRMHLYLNQLDNLACPPTWEKRLEKGSNYVRVDHPESIEYLTHCLWAHALPYLQELRKQQTEMEVKLSKEYEELEKQTSLLSVNLGENKEAYLKSCDTLIQTIGTLTEISDNVYWSKMFTYFKKLQKLVSSTPSAELIEVKSKPKNTSEKTTAMTANRNQIQSKSPHSQQSLFSKSNKENALSIKTNNQIKGMETLLDKISESKDPSIKALYLKDLNNQLMTMDIEKEDSLTCMQLKTLSAIEKKLAAQAKLTLETALLKEEYNHARLLYPFYSLANGGILLAFALVQQNPRLLDFLFETIGLPLNSYPITIKQKTYANAVEYCFLESRTNASLVDCFSVLIKHGADLMLPLGADKLPLAHQILSAKPAHPLLVALEKNRKLTLDNQLFYNQLIKLLNTYLISNNYEEHYRNEIQACILNYEKQKSYADFLNVLVPRNQVLLSELSEIGKQILSKAMLEALQEDKEISKEAIELQKESKAIIKSVQIFQKKTGKIFALQSLINSHGENYKQELLKANLTVDLDFSALKTMVLQNLSDQRLIITHCENLMKIQTAIIQTPHIHGKKNKKLKQLERQQQQLIKEIEILRMRMPEAMLQKYNAFQENLSLFKDNIEDQLTDLSNLIEKLNLILGYDQNAQKKEPCSFKLEI